MTEENNYSKELENQLNELLDENLDLVRHLENTAFDQLTKSFGDRMVLFGAGELGCKTLSGLRLVGIEPLAFADNNPKLWNTAINGLQVLSPQDAVLQFGQTATFVITIWRANGGDRQAVRRKQLLDLNCANVISFGYLFWKYPDVFFPHACLELPSTFHQHTNELRKLFYMWADDDSRREYLAQLRFRMKLDFDGLASPVSHKQYFPDDLFTILPDEVFIDCGAFDGDTIREFLQHNKNFSGKILAFEPDQINFHKLQEYISTLPEPIRNNVITNQVPVGTCGQKVRFMTTGTVSSRVIENGEVELNCVCIDQQMIDAAPSFIKMDIEGAEIDALNGARKTIQRFRPILAICVYHKPDHLWKIPLLISSCLDDYRFFLRPHDEESWDLVCYAIPKERLLRGMFSGLS
jgi:FkbM family methyltransferase